jgi:Recombinase
MTIPASQRAACEAHQARADERATKLAPIVKELQARGTTSLNGIAAALNARRIRTPAGRRHWHPTQVRRVLKRLAGQGTRDASFDAPGR